jgi:hypothetical protein
MSQLQKRSISKVGEEVHPMSQDADKKCGYSQCQCMVTAQERYCSDYCKDAQSEKEIEIQCDCKHEACALD